MSPDPNDLESLTPDHLLIGQPLLAVLEVGVTGIPNGLLTRWKLLNQCHRRFWRRWSSRYLFCLQNRNKSPGTQLEVGDLVIIKDSSVSPLAWRMVRITEVLPTQDKIVRVVRVFIQQSTVTRPVVKLVRLPYNPDM